MKNGGILNMRMIHKELEDFQLERGWEISKESADKSTESLLLNHLLLTTEIAEIAEELRRMLNRAYDMKEEGVEGEKAFQLAKEEVAEDIGKEIADSIAYLCKFATFFQRDIEQDIKNKLNEIQSRTKPNLQKRMKEGVR
jgi:NTP pyrophosphatase (non-canonical NTP hydrolase)